MVEFCANTFFESEFIPSNSIVIGTYKLDNKFKKWFNINVFWTLDEQLMWLVFCLQFFHNIYF